MDDLEKAIKDLRRRKSSDEEEEECSPFIDTKAWLRFAKKDERLAVKLLVAEYEKLLKLREEFENQEVHVNDKEKDVVDRFEQFNP